MLSKKDKEILKFIDIHGSITINQAAKCIYTGNKYAYDQARKQLRQLYKEKAILRYRDSMKGEVIYYIDNPLTIHSLKLIDVYAELVGMGAKVDKFLKKYRIYVSSEKYRELDGLIELNYDGYFIPIIVEIDYSHNTSIKKLQEIYESNHFQDKYKNIEENMFPTIIIARPVVEICLSDDNDFTILYTDFELGNLAAALD